MKIPRILHATTAVGLLILSACALQTAKVEVSPNVCKPGLVEGPGATFSVMTFCDDAAGTTIGIIKSSSGDLLDPDSPPDRPVSSPHWRLENRFWQDKDWARDVLSFEFSEDGTQLIVITNYIYNEGNRYVLDLQRRQILSVTKLPMSFFSNDTH